MHAVQDDMHVRMRGVVVTDIDGLMLAPSHLGEIAVGGFDHLVGCRRLVGCQLSDIVLTGRCICARPVRAIRALEFILRGGGCPHLIDGKMRIVVDAIACRHECDPVIGLGLPVALRVGSFGFVVQIVFAGATKARPLLETFGTMINLLCVTTRCASRTRISGESGRVRPAAAPGNGCSDARSD